MQIEWPQPRLCARKQIVRFRQLRPRARRIWNNSLTVEPGSAADESSVRISIAGVHVVLPLVGLILLWSIGIGLGMLLLIIPGIILLLMWSVAIPSLVEERQGVFAAFA